MAEARNRGPLISAGTLLGVGMGGFVDGIVLHQLAQVHNMLSGKYPTTTLVNAEINMFWDGLFHAFCWVVTALGLALLWRAGQRSDVPGQRGPSSARSSWASASSISSRASLTTTSSGFTTSSSGLGSRCGTSAFSPWEESP